MRDYDEQKQVVMQDSFSGTVCSTASSRQLRGSDDIRICTSAHQSWLSREKDRKRDEMKTAVSAAAFTQCNINTSFFAQNSIVELENADASWTL